MSDERTSGDFDSDMAWDHDENQCPLAAIDRRLEDGYLHQLGINSVI